MEKFRIFKNFSFIFTIEAHLELFCERLVDFKIKLLLVFQRKIVKN